MRVTAIYNITESYCPQTGQHSYVSNGTPVIKSYIDQLLDLARLGVARISDTHVNVSRESITGSYTLSYYA
jgi:hypothetical protein